MIRDPEKMKDINMNIKQKLISNNYLSVNDNKEFFSRFYLPQINPHIKKWYVDKE